MLVWKLWEEAHGGISNGDWNDMKKEVIKTWQEKVDQKLRSLSVKLEDLEKRLIKVASRMGL